LFILAWTVIERRIDLLLRMIRSGAVWTALVLSLWWYVFCAVDQGTRTFLRELRDVTEGSDHAASALIYIPAMLLGTAPWLALFCVAIVLAPTRWRSSAGIRTVI